MIQFTHFVGTSPGTTTMEVPAMNGLGVCPPGYYGNAIMLPGGASHAGSTVTTTAPTAVAVDPYATESKLSGLRGAIRWDILLLGFGLAFAGVLGYSFFRIRKTKLLGRARR